MPNADEATNVFMTNKIKESLGESTETEEVKEDNYEVESLKVRNTFSNEGETVKENKGMLLLRRIMNFMLVIPIIIVSLLFLFYFVLSIMPNFLSMLRKLFFAIF